MDNMKLNANLIKSMEAGRILDELIATHIFDEAYPGRFDKPHYWILDLDRWKPIPFSMSIPHSWNVVQALMESGFECYIKGVFEWENIYEVSFKLKDYFTAQANTIALAICRASLLAWLGEK